MSWPCYARHLLASCSTLCQLHGPGVVLEVSTPQLSTRAGGVYLLQLQGALGGLCQGRLGSLRPGSCICTRNTILLCMLGLPATKAPNQFMSCHVTWITGHDGQASGAHIMPGAKGALPVRRYAPVQHSAGLLGLVEVIAPMSDAVFQLSIAAGRRSC